MVLKPYELDAVGNVPCAGSCAPEEGPAYLSSAVMPRVELQTQKTNQRTMVRSSRPWWTIRYGQRGERGPLPESQARQRASDQAGCLNGCLALIRCENPLAKMSEGVYRRDGGAEEGARENWAKLEVTFLGHRKLNQTPPLRRVTNCPRLGHSLTALIISGSWFVSTAGHSERTNLDVKAERWTGRKPRVEVDHVTSASM